MVRNISHWISLKRRNQNGEELSTACQTDHPSGRRQRKYERLYSKISTFGTETSILFILNVLFSICFAADYDANIERKIGTARELEISRQTNEQALRES